MYMTVHLTGADIALTCAQVQGLQQYIVGAVPAGMPGLPPLQALAKADPSAYVIPPQLARSQEVLLNSHRRACLIQP